MLHFIFVTNQNEIIFQAFLSLSLSLSLANMNTQYRFVSCFSSHNFATVSFWQIEDNFPIRFAYIAISIVGKNTYLKGLHREL